MLLELNGVARMCGLVPEDLDEMDAADYQAVKARFLECVGVTGKSVGGEKLLARWFRFQPSEIDRLTVEKFCSWVEGASEQIKREHGDG
ncbi:phage tail assembly protein (plasmid) [Ralstonia syzygii subsp. celebesensis]